MILNPLFDSKNAKYQDEDITDQWVLKGQFQVYDFKVQNAQYQIDTSSKSIVSVSSKNYSQLTDLIFNKLCGKKECKKEEGKIKDLSDLSLSFQNINIHFSPKEYTYVDGNNTYRLRINANDQLRDDQLVLGGFGLTKLNLILATLADGKKKVFLIDNYERLELNREYEKFIYAGIIVFCLIILITYFLVGRKKAKEEIVSHDEPLIV